MNSPKVRDANVRTATAYGSATEAFLGRIHDGAAAVLTAEQLKRFEELQEEQLTRSRARVQRLRDAATQ